MRRAWAAALLASSLALAGCAPVVGVVTNKEHDAAETERYSCSKTVNGKSKFVVNGCTRRDDEDWELTVVDAEDRMHEVEVSRAEYDRIQIGDTYDSEAKR